MGFKILGNIFHRATAKFSLSYFHNAQKIFWVTKFILFRFMVSRHRACFHCLLKFALSWDLSDSCLIVELETCPAIISSSRHLYTSLSPPFVSSGLNDTSSYCLSTSCLSSYGFPCSDFRKKSPVTTCNIFSQIVADCPALSFKFGYLQENIAETSKQQAWLQWEQGLEVALGSKLLLKPETTNPLQ